LHFKYYLANQTLSSALHSNFITSVFEDSHHRLWVGTDDDGIYLLNLSVDKFYSYNDHCTQKIKSVLSIEEDYRKRICVDTKQGLYTLDEKTNYFEINKDVNAELIKQIYPGVKDISGNRWWISGDELKFYDANAKKIYDSKNNPLHISILDTLSLESITTDTKNNLWACSNSNAVVYKYDIPGKKMEVYSFPGCLDRSGIKNKNAEISLRKIFADKHDNVWLSLPGMGLSNFDAKKNKFSIVIEDNNGYEFYDSSLILRNKNYPILEDKEGNLWAGGFTNFIFFHPVSDSAFAPPDE
jgi:ligand-binding sensor domain-containing protein